MNYILNFAAPSTKASVRLGRCPVIGGSLADLVKPCADMKRPWVHHGEAWDMIQTHVIRHVIRQ